MFVLVEFPPFRNSIRHSSSGACHPSPAGGRGKRPNSLLKKASQRPAVDDSIIYHESPGALMRGVFADQGGLFSYISPEARVPANHPLRKIREALEKGGRRVD